MPDRPTTPSAPPSRFLYVFLDEAGNLDFSAQGTKFFLLGAITKERPFHAYKEMAELKYDLVELGTNVQIADYCTWAIYRKWNRCDARSYQLIQPAVKSEFDIFRTGTRFYY